MINNSQYENKTIESNISDHFPILTLLDEKVCPSVMDAQKKENYNMGSKLHLFKKLFRFNKISVFFSITCYKKLNLTGQLIRNYKH